MEVLSERGAAISYNDPYVPELPRMGLTSVGLENLAAYDAVVLVTAHPGIDYAAVLEHSELLVDLRGITRKLQSERRQALVATA
jgi:UDP-N-acetyl-D-glucosamine dehydrogenase